MYTESKMGLQEKIHERPVNTLHPCYTFLTMMHAALHTTAYGKIPYGSQAESRLIYKGDLGQFGRDLRDFHLRADGAREAAGSVILAPAAAIMKAPNALVGTLSNHPADPLPEGPLAYTRRDVWSLLANTGNAAKNLVTLHPLRATGNVIKGVFDAGDVLTDPFLDFGAAIAGHTRRKASSVLSSAA